MNTASDTRRLSRLLALGLILALGVLAAVTMLPSAPGVRDHAEADTEFTEAAVPLAFPPSAPSGRTALAATRHAGVYHAPVGSRFVFDLDYRIGIDMSATKGNDTAPTSGQKLHGRGQLELTVAARRPGEILVMAQLPDLTLEAAGSNLDETAAGWRAPLFVKMTEDGRPLGHAFDAQHDVGARNMLRGLLCLLAVGKLSDAHTLAEDTVNRSLRLLGPRHPLTLGRKAQLANVLVTLGQRDEAERLLRTTLAAQQSELSAEHPAVLRTTNQLGGVMLSQGRPQEALEYLRRVWTVGERVLGVDHPTRLVSGTTLAQALLEAGEGEAALAQIDTVRAAADRSGQPDHPIIPRVVAIHARILHAAGDLEGAEVRYRAAIKDMRRVAGPSNSMVLDLSCRLARVYEKTDRLDDAEKLARDVREKLARDVQAPAGTNENRFARIDKLLADIAHRRGQGRG